MGWFALSLCTAVFWGLGYALTEKIMQNGVSSAFFLAAICAFSVPVYVGISFYNNTVQSSLTALNDQKTFLMAAAAIIIFILGNLFIMQAIQLKNATYANLIEITYPVFTILFTYLLFKTLHLDWSTTLGGLLILGGVFLVFYKSGA